MYEREIDRGVRLLDRHRGNRWPFEIDESSLHMDSMCNCVLGQVYGGYEEGLEVLEMVSGENFHGPVYAGFEADGYETEKWSRLTREWKTRIQQLKEERA